VDSLLVGLVSGVEVKLPPPGTLAGLIRNMNPLVSLLILCAPVCMQI
jgi:hypothetical protein